MPCWDGGSAQQPEDERENQHRWEDSDDDLEADDMAPWRGTDATVHPVQDYPGKDADLEKEGDGHGGGA